LGVSCVLAVASSFIALAAPSHARGNPPCPYRVIVSREDLSGEQSARVCDLNRIAEWLAAVPDATVSTQPPHGSFRNGYTGTIAAAPKHGQESHSGRRRVLLIERVHPVAEAGPVAFVPSRTVLLRHPGPFPKWIVNPGWRALDASMRLPPVLRRLGMLRPTASVATPSAIPT